MLGSAGSPHDQANDHDGVTAMMRSFSILVAAIVLVAVAVSAACTGPATTASGPVPPPFSRRIVSVFPGSPFVICDVGHFDDAVDGSSASQRWYIRPSSAGDLRIDVYALGGNPAEGGTLSAELFGPANAMLAASQVAFPNGVNPRPNVATLRASVTALSIHRLEIRRNPAPGMGQAHHYRLGFSGMPAEIGVNSPALPHWLEGLNFGRQVFHVNVDAGEELRLALTAGEGQPIPSMTLELRDENDALLLLTLWSTWDPFDVVLGPSTVARTLRVVTSGNHHFTLAKTSGSDRGIYFDTCPPPAALVSAVDAPDQAFQRNASISWHESYPGHREAGEHPQHTIVSI